MRTPSSTAANGTEPSVLPFRSLAQSPVAVENRDTAGPLCIHAVKSQEPAAVNEIHITGSRCTKWPRQPQSLIGRYLQTPSAIKTLLILSNIPEQLALFILDMIPNRNGNELSDAFQNATELPPITGSSLNELDITMILGNIKLRHDCNFDRDLSFRPNLDGSKGLDKMRVARKFWKALEAELVLYSHLFPKSHLLSHLEDWPEIVAHSQKRIPQTFETIKTILKSLVPDRDHPRVDEQLDIEMLMGGIRRGMCDLVRLSQWFACLLKEHCAPMRDEWVDKMVEWTRLGVETNKPEYIVNGLRELLGILEAMKLDVANHQIRNMKMSLIEDTIHYQYNFHLNFILGLTNRRINVAAIQRWYMAELETFSLSDPSRQRISGRAGAVVLVQGITRLLFSNNARCEFPDSFYLDHDRLRTLKSDIDYHTYFEICFELFRQLSKGFGYSMVIPATSKQTLYNSLEAIMSDNSSSGPSPWWINSEHIAAELIRQALVLNNRAPNYNSKQLDDTNRTLRAMYETAYVKHSKLLEELVLAQTLASITRYISSSPVELYNTFVSVGSSPTSRIPPALSIHSATENKPSPLSELPTNFSNRIAHIIILHWRIWGELVYRMNNDNSVNGNIAIGAQGLSKDTSTTTRTSPTGEGASEPAVVALLKTGDPPEQGGQGALENTPTRFS